MLFFFVTFIGHPPPTNLSKCLKMHDLRCIKLFVPGMTSVRYVLTSVDDCTPAPHSQRPQSAQFASSVTFHTWAGPELESGQTLSILRMPGHGIGKCCNISHLGMALVTYYRTQIHQDGCCLSTFWGGWVFRRGDVHPSCHGYPLAVTNIFVQPLRRMNIIGLSSCFPCTLLSTLVFCN